MGQNTVGREIGDKGEEEGEKGRGKRNCPRGTKTASGQRRDHVGKCWFLKVKWETLCYNEVFNFN